MTLRNASWADLGIRRLPTKVGLLGGVVDVAVRRALEVGLLGENKVEELNS